MSDTTASDSDVGAPILFVLGPSGVGKSQLGTWIAEDFNFLHLEIDTFVNGDGIDIHGLRREWDAYYLRNQGGRKLAETVRRKIGNRVGAVLTFPGQLLLSSQQIAAGAAVGIRTVILYGSRSDLLDAFLAREQQSGRGLGKAHWEANNAKYPSFGGNEFELYREVVFEDHRRRGRESLVDAMRRRLAQ